MTQYEARTSDEVVEARQWGGTVNGATAIINWILKSDWGASYDEIIPGIRINTSKGGTMAIPLDYIVKGSDGEFRAMSPMTFKQLYKEKK